MPGEIAQLGGLYRIVNDATGDYYVGASISMMHRRQQHFASLRLGKHRNRRLQRAWNKYGEAVFRFEVLTVLEKSDVYASEARLLRLHFGKHECYNLKTETDETRKGVYSAESTQRRIATRLANRKPPTAENRKNWSEGQRRRRARDGNFLAEINRGKPQTKEARLSRTLGHLKMTRDEYEELREGVKLLHAMLPQYGRIRLAYAAKTTESAVRAILKEA